MKKGQVLVVTLLVLSVLMTVALSIASRSVTEVQVSSTQDESTRALEAAEIGLERYVGADVTQTNQKVDDLNASFNVPPPAVIGSGTSFAVPYSLVEGDVATIDLPAKPTFVKVCWGDGSVVNPKIEVGFFYEDAAHNILVKRNGYDPDSSANHDKGFYNINTSGSDTCGTTTHYSYSYQIILNNSHNIGGMDLDLISNSTIFMRVRMLGNGSTSQPVAVQSNLALPNQGGVVESVGVAGNTSQKVRATVSRWDLPSMFDSAIFSGTSLTK